MPMTHSWAKAAISEASKGCIATRGSQSAPGRKPRTTTSSGHYTYYQHLWMRSHVGGGKWPIFELIPLKRAASEQQTGPVTTVIDG